MNQQKEKQQKKRLNIIHLSCGSYFGDEELIQHKHRRHTKAVVKSLDAEVYIMSSDFFMNTLKLNNSVKLLLKENEKIHNIEEN